MLGLPMGLCAGFFLPLRCTVLRLTLDFLPAFEGFLIRGLGALNIFSGVRVFKVLGGARFCE